jgi:hypothetical protein
MKAQAVPMLVVDYGSAPTVVLPLAERRMYPRRSTGEIFFSIFPPDPDMVSVHPHQLPSEAGRWLVFEWGQDEIGNWHQLGAPTNVASFKNALEYVPPGFEAVATPEGWAAGAWRKR